jgi:hypothetical protein
MFAYFGGVTPYVVVDNLKSGVNRADLYDPDVNATYCDFANHMGFAVLPARPRKPRDKGSGESHIGVVQRGFFQEVRNRVFYSLQDLNEALRDYLQRLNHAVMKDYGVSRSERFAEEKKQLKPLPASPFELSDWRQAKVHPDCHIQVEKNFYSVPFIYVGQKVRVRLTDKIVEVFSEDSQPLTAHTRLRGIGQFSTYDFHYPEKKLSVVRFEVRHAQSQAKLLGPHVEQLVEQLFSTSHPLRHLRWSSCALCSKRNCCRRPRRRQIPIRSPFIDLGVVELLDSVGALFPTAVTAPQILNIRRQKAAGPGCLYVCAVGLVRVWMIRSKSAEV